MGGIDDIKDILRGALASLGGFGGRMLARLAMLFFAGSYYGAEKFGHLGEVAAITEIMAAAAVLGLKRTLLDMLSAKDAADKTGQIIKEALLASLILASIMSVGLGFAWSLLFPDAPMPFILYLAVPGIVVAEVAGTAIRFKRIIRWEVIARCVMEPWAFFAAVLIFYWVGMTEIGLISAYAISCIAAAIGISIGLSGSIGWKTILSAPLRPRQLYHIPRKSFPIGVTDIGVMMFRRADILLLSIFVPGEVTGIYYMAQQIVTVPHKIYQLFEPMMAPVLAKLHHDAKRDVIGAKLAGFCRWVFTLQLAITVPFILFGGELMGLFGSEYMVGALVLAALLTAELMDGSFALTETALVFAKPKVPPMLILMALMIEFSAIYFFAGEMKMGAEGAAVGFLIAMGSLAAARLFMLWRYLDIKIIGLAFLIPVGFGGVTAAALILLRQTMPMTDGAVFGPTILISIFLFVGLVRILALTPADKLILQQLKSSS